MKFVNLHAHSGVGSPFDGFGYPQEHMDFAYENGCEALALTDHGNMNGFAYQVLHAKKMKAAGKNFKPIFGVEAYFIPSVEEWKVKLEESANRLLQNLHSNGFSPVCIRSCAVRLEARVNRLLQNLHSGGFSCFLILV